MFYCNDCAEEKKYPLSGFKSHGRCEICKQIRQCNDVPSRDLPKKEELKQKCSYYNGRMKCAFFGQEKCVYDKGMVPFPYICGVESQMEEQATREP